MYKLDRFEREFIEYIQLKGACPECGSGRIVRVIYADRPSPAVWQAASRREVKLRPWSDLTSQPTRFCKTCGHDWYDEDDEPERSIPPPDLHELELPGPLIPPRGGDD